MSANTVVRGECGRSLTGNSRARPRMTPYLFLRARIVAQKAIRVPHAMRQNSQRPWRNHARSALTGGSWPTIRLAPGNDGGQRSPITGRTVVLEPCCLDRRLGWRGHQTHHLLRWSARVTQHFRAGARGVGLRAGRRWSAFFTTRERANPTYEPRHSPLSYGSFSTVASVIGPPPVNHC